MTYQLSVPHCYKTFEQLFRISLCLVKILVLKSELRSRISLAYWIPDIGPMTSYLCWGSYCVFNRNIIFSFLSSYFRVLRPNDVVRGDHSLWWRPYYYMLAICHYLTQIQAAVVVWDHFHAQLGFLLVGLTWHLWMSYLFSRLAPPTPQH